MPRRSYSPPIADDEASIILQPDLAAHAQGPQAWLFLLRDFPTRASVHLVSRSGRSLTRLLDEEPLNQPPTEILSVDPKTRNSSARRLDGHRASSIGRHESLSARGCHNPPR
jgi:hypothetical protein